MLFVLFPQLCLWSCAYLDSVISTIQISGHVIILAKICHLSLYLFRLMFKNNNSHKTNVCTSPKPATSVLPPSPWTQLVKSSSSWIKLPWGIVSLSLKCSNIHQIMSLIHQSLPKLLLFVPKLQTSSTEKAGGHGRFSLPVGKLTLIAF